MRAIIFRKIAIAAGVAFTIVAIAAALPTKASAQYYGSRYGHGGFGWGFGHGLPFRFGAPYYYGYGYGAYSGYRYYDYSYGGPYEFGENSTNQDESADCLWRRRWANDFQGRRVWRRTSGCY